MRKYLSNLGLILKFLHIFLGIFSAGLSTISAGLNALTAVTLEDFIKPTYRKCRGYEISSKKLVFIAKMLGVTFGIITILLAFLVQFLGGLLQVMIFWYYIEAQFIGVILVQYSPNASQYLVNISPINCATGVYYF